MPKSKISIIVPVYNSEKYLPKCIESILNQTYENIEIILINDGSTDESINVCNRYAQYDKRIIVINKENGGVSSARNRGLDIASGDYIGFVDSDDFIDNKMYERLLATSLEYDADIVECGYNRIDEDYKETKKFPLKDAIIEGNYECSKSYLAKVNTTNFNVNKLYKKFIFDNLRYPNLSHSEDYVVNAKAFYKCNRKATISDCYYYYVNRKGSACHQPLSEKRLDGIRAAMEIYEYHNERFSDLCTLILMYLLDIIIRRYKQINELNINERNDYKKKLLLEYRKHYKKLKDNQNHLYFTEVVTQKRIGYWLFNKSPQVYSIIYRMLKSSVNN